MQQVSLNKKDVKLLTKEKSINNGTVYLEDGRIYKFSRDFLYDVNIRNVFTRSNYGIDPNKIEWLSSKQKDIIITKNEVIFIVGDTQRISIAKVNGKVEMDFRSYHFDDVMFLGKYGLNMSLKDWDNLKKKMKEIDEAIYKLSH